VLAPCPPPHPPAVKWHVTENARNMAENSDATFFFLPTKNANTTDKNSRLKIPAVWAMADKIEKNEMGGACSAYGG